MLHDLPTILILGALFVVLERVLPLHRGQRVLRPEVGVDLLHYIVNSSVAAVGLGIVLMPLMVVVGALVPAGVRSAVGAQATWLQVIELTLVSDVAIYVGHRLTHVVPWLWRFHAIHHSATDVDWLTTTRIHPVDLVFTRGCMLLAGFALGFSARAWALYAVYYAAQSLFLHANIRVRLGPLSLLYAGPEFHRWHHSNAAEARDKNFVTHFPWLDWLFGTLYLPGWSPDRYGTEEIIPDGYLRQLIHPFGSPPPTTGR
jgi:sterol desaturase/sphingolipid hydroxylase (fatty acid hydroxylase superfamily)